MNVFFSRAMDGRPTRDIVEGDEQVLAALEHCGLRLINPYIVNDQRRTSISGISNIVESDLYALTAADLVIFDFSIPNWFYMGAVLEMAKAFELRKPIYAWVGSSGNQNRTWLKYHADGIFETLRDLQEVLWLSYDEAGISHRRTMAQEYYSEVSRWYDSTSTKGERVLPVPDAVRFAEFKQEALLLRQWLAQVKVGQRVLDLGSGTGCWVPFWLRSAKSVVCVDESEAMLARSRERNPSGLVTHIQGNILDERWVSELVETVSADTIVLGYVLNSLDIREQSRFIRSLRAKCRADTQLLVFENQWSIFSRPDWYSRTEIQTRGVPESGKKYRILKRHFSRRDLCEILNSWGTQGDSFHTENYFVGGWAIG